MIKSRIQAVTSGAPWRLRGLPEFSWRALARELWPEDGAAPDRGRPVERWAHDPRASGRRPEPGARRRPPDPELRQLHQPAGRLATLLAARGPRARPALALPAPVPNLRGPGAAARSGTASACLAPTRTAPAWPPAWPPRVPGAIDQPRPGPPDRGAPAGRRRALAQRAPRGAPSRGSRLPVGRAGRPADSLRHPRPARRPPPLPRPGLRRSPAPPPDRPKPRPGTGAPGRGALHPGLAPAGLPGRRRAGDFLASPGYWLPCLLAPPAWRRPPPAPPPTGTGACNDTRSRRPSSLPAAWPSSGRPAPSCPAASTWPACATW